MPDQEETSLGVEVTVDGKTYAIDDFELGELQELESVCGQGWLYIDYRSVTALSRIVLIVRRRTNPRLTPEDIGGLTIRDLMKIAKQPEQEEVPPPEPDPEPKAKKAKATA